MDILISYHHWPLLLAIVALTILKRKSVKELFQKDKDGHDFSQSLNIFHQFSPKAQATFLYRFVESLRPTQIKIIQKYISLRTK
jgi:hypothetical protein